MYISQNFGTHRSRKRRMFVLLLISWYYFLTYELSDMENSVPDVVDGSIVFAYFT